MTLLFYDICQPAFNLEGKNLIFALIHQFPNMEQKNHVECKNSKIGRKFYNNEKLNEKT